LLVDHRGRAPVAPASADLSQEAIEDAGAVRGVHDLGVELDAVELAVPVLDGGYR
jgi:hypothetical protein